MLLITEFAYLIQAQLIIVIGVAHAMFIESGLELVAVCIATITLFVYFKAILVSIIDTHWKGCLRLRPSPPI